LFESEQSNRNKVNETKASTPNTNERAAKAVDLREIDDTDSVCESQCCPYLLESTSTPKLELAA